MEKRAIALLPVLGWFGLVAGFILAVVYFTYPSSSPGETITNITGGTTFIFYGLLVWSITLSLAFVARNVSNRSVPPSE